LVATPIQQLAKRTDGPMKFQPVAKAERQGLAQRAQEVQKSRDQRRTLEATAVATSARRPGTVIEPVKAQLPKSPIVAKPVDKLARNQAPPKAQKAPKPDPKFQAKSQATGRQPNVDQSKPQSEPRQPLSEKQSPPGRSEAAPRAQKATASPEQSRASKPLVTAHAPEAPPPQQFKTQSQNSRPVSGAVRAPGINQPAGQNGGALAEQTQKPPQVSASNARRAPAVRAKHEQLASEQGRLKQSKDQSQKAVVQQTPRAKQAEPPSSQ
jgi:hypothetical protein